MSCIVYLNEEKIEKKILGSFYELEFCSEN